jgi:hypothetical protein
MQEIEFHLPGFTDLYPAALNRYTVGNRRYLAGNGMTVNFCKPIQCTFFYRISRGVQNSGTGLEIEGLKYKKIFVYLVEGLI